MFHQVRSRKIMKIAMANKKGGSKSHESWKNYANYSKDRSEKLKNGVLQHPDEKDGVYDYMKKNVKRNMWVMDFKQFEKIGESLGEGFDWDEPLSGGSDESELDEPIDKWLRLEQDITDAIGPILDKHQDNFGSDSYAVIDAMYEVLDGMFQKIRK